MAKNKVLVTGGCGYIGSHTLTELVRQTNYDLVSVDSLTNSAASALEQVEKITGRKIKNYAIDLCDYHATEQVFAENPDITGIIHFAALKSVPDSVAMPLHYYRNNVNSLINILELADRYGVENFIFSSSCSVYGNVSQLPVNEETPLQRAESPYAYTKQIGERIIEDFCRNKPLKAMALRYFNPVGADKSGLNGENPINKPNNLVPVITRTAAGILPEMLVFGQDYPTRDGSCIRDFIHVSDIAEAHIKALQYLSEHQNTPNYEVLNLGTGLGVTVLEAISAFEEVSGMKLNYKIVQRRTGDVAAIYSDTQKSEKLLGWKPQYGIKEMMKTAWLWQKRLLNHPS